MATNCLVCSTKLRQNGGEVKYCSRGKTGCRRKRTQFARETLLQAAKRTTLGQIQRVTDEQIRKFGKGRR